MPKKVKELSAIEVRRLIAPGRHAVGGVDGLLLHVQPSGARSWVLRTIIGSKRRNIGLGGYPDVSLKAARDKAQAIKDGGTDPVMERKAKKTKLTKAQMTFAEAAKKCHKMKASEFRSDKHVKDWISSVKLYAIPALGNKPVSEITTDDIIGILEPIWIEKTETATRLRQRIEAILSWAGTAGHREGLNPARWKEHLENLLSKPSKVKNVVNMPSLPYKEMFSFMRRLRAKNTIGAKAIEFIILTAARSKEVRFATWDEIDLDKRMWKIPKHKMKAGKEHQVPLSNQAIKLLESLPRFEGSNYLFTAPRGGALGDATTSKICRVMKIGAVPHGFRATFKTWCLEMTSYPNILSEMALAHTVGNKVEQTYTRTDLFEKRARLMQDWADFIDREQVNADVVPIRKIA